MALGSRTLRRQLFAFGVLVAAIAVLIVTAVNFAIEYLPGHVDLWGQNSANERQGDQRAEHATARPSQVPAHAEAVIVERVVDGDTIRVIAPPESSIPAGGAIRVRLLNIDAPELARGGRPAECGADEARTFVTSLLQPADLVWIVADTRDRDRFDRPLRAMWTADGTFVNEAIVSAGWATAVLFPPDDHYYAAMQEAERAAAVEARGIWGLCLHR